MGNAESKSLEDALREFAAKSAESDEEARKEAARKKRERDAQEARDRDIAALLDNVVWPIFNLIYASLTDANLAPITGNEDDIVVIGKSQVRRLIHVMFDHPNDKNEDRASRRKVQIVFGSAGDSLGVYVAEPAPKPHQYPNQNEYHGDLIAAHSLSDLKTHGDVLLRDDFARAVGSIGTFKRR